MAKVECLRRGLSWRREKVHEEVNPVRTALLALLPLLPASLPAQRGGRGGGRGGAPSNLVVAGSVLLPDGVVPHRIVRLQRVCGGHAAGSAFTDSRVRYSFDLDVLYDPMTGVIRSQGRGASSRDSAPMFDGCFIRAGIEGFRGNAIEIAPLVKTRKTNAPPIQLVPIAKDQTIVLSVTDSSAGTAARKDFDKGLDLVAQGKFHDVAAMQRVVSGRTKVRYCLAQFGTFQVSQQDLPGATGLTQKAIEADPRLAAPHIELVGD